VVVVGRVLLNVKCMVSFSLKPLCETFLILGIIQPEILS
jgi:hypothetical protein